MNNDLLVKLSAYTNDLSESKKRMLSLIKIEGNEIIYKDKHIVKGEYVKCLHGDYIYVYDLKNKTYSKIRKSEDNVKETPIES